MRNFATAAAVAAVSTFMLAGGAWATDVCRGPLTATGATHSGHFHAMQNAMRAWERGVARRDGRRFASWTYSVERTVTCTWRGEGYNAIYTCRATAEPCARAS